MIGSCLFQIFLGFPSKLNHENLGCGFDDNLIVDFLVRMIISSVIYNCRLFWFKISDRNYLL